MGHLLEQLPSAQHSAQFLFQSGQDGLHIAVCFGDPTAWIAADLFLVPAFVYVYGRLKRMTPPEKPIGGR